MESRVRAQNDDHDRALIREASVSVVIEPDWNTHDTFSQEDFQTWLDAFRKRYAESLEYLRSH